jgi:hypothetical protein
LLSKKRAPHIVGGIIIRGRISQVGDPVLGILIFPPVVEAAPSVFGRIFTM